MSIQSRTNRTSFLRLLSFFTRNQVAIVTAIILLSIFQSLALMYTPVIIRDIVDKVIDELGKGSDISIATYRIELFMYIGLSLIASILSFITLISSVYFVQRTVLSIRQKVIRHSLRQSMNFFNYEPVGKMVTRVSSDLDKIGEFFSTFMNQLFSSIVSLGTILILMFYLDWKLSISSLIAVPIFVVFIEIFRRRIYILSNKDWEANVNSNKYVSEHITGISDIQLLGKQEQTRHNFSTLNDVLYDAESRLAKTYSFIQPILDFLLNGIIILVLIVSTILFSSELLTIGTIIAFTQLIQRFFSPVITIAQNINSLQNSVVSLRKTYDFLHTERALIDVGTSPSLASKSPASRYLSSKNNDTSFSISDKPELELKNIGFSYDGKHQILKNICFTLKNKQKIALVGYSGSGKTSIARLLIRLWDPTAGNIYLDGKDIRDIPLKILRKHLILLQQESYIVRGTILENIALGRTLDDTHLAMLYSVEGIKRLVDRGKHGWHSTIDKNSLSNGERRLVAISRVLVSRPKILILDEYSAAIDNNTERDIQKLLDMLFEHCAAIIIAHRINTIKKCDVVYYIADGEIVEQGNHDTLIADTNSHYAKLVASLKVT